MSFIENSYHTGEYIKGYTITIKYTKSDKRDFIISWMILKSKMSKSDTAA